MQHITTTDLVLMMDQKMLKAYSEPMNLLLSISPSKEIGPSRNRTHNLWIGLVAQSLEQRLMKSRGSGLIPAKVRNFLLCLVWSPISLLGLALCRKFIGSLKHTLQS